MSNYRLAVIDSSELAAYKLRARQRNVIQNVRHLHSRTGAVDIHVSDADWRIINEAVLKQSSNARSLHNVTLGGVRLLAAIS